ncbi:LacI family DNA-binding transcriptional regulator [Lapillicoccus jejuensis]|uniref:LacI family transcriptional regulator n=1 Tax=Lapillicoccus jejuensis TaxID=402171 RepID=A0A542DYM7_9MICO|nr:LacI family DNA-binding transcriptional regulator [Lapillicoccus jejuensis]TQJ08159.1 LacI family transcriptional regulator [Lapillicoccus jejuensis]
MSSGRRERVTISDIAARLGISKASVSYALNGRPGVSAETRERVLALADELGFHASSAAVALSAARTGTIGIVIARDPEVITAEGFYMRTLFGVEQYLNDADGQLLLRLTGERGEDLHVYRRWARQGRVDGFILYDEHDDDPRVPLLHSLQVPGVMVTSVAKEDGIGRLVTPESETVRVMLDHLKSLGHKRIAHLSGPTAYLHERVRVETMQREGEDRGLAVRHVEGTYEFASGEEATTRLLGLSARTRPTAIVAGNDIMATAALKAAADLGVGVPDQLSVLAWDDSVLCHTSRPRLTAMDHGLMEKARLATDLLYHLIDGGTQTHRVSPVGTLLVRDTTGPLAR